MIIYQIRNLVTQQTYVGQTTKTIDHRWNLHLRNLKKGSHDNSHLQNAWNKYGADNFECFELDKCSTLEELNELEMNYIRLFKSIGMSYNVLNGGQQDKWDIIRREKISKSMTGRKVSEETKNKISHSLMGRKKSQETRYKMSGKVRSVDHSKALSESLTGHSVSQETRNKISNSKLGKPLSPDHIEKLKGRVPWNKGLKNNPNSKDKNNET
jgi:group I intron endonuclease